MWKFVIYVQYIRPAKQTVNTSNLECARMQSNQRAIKETRNGCKMDTKEMRQSHK